MSEPATASWHRKIRCLPTGLDDHVVCVLDGHGEVVDRFTLEHSSAGLAGLIRRLGKFGCREVAIERPDGPVVDALLDASLTVVVISPNQVKNLRSRYGSAGNKDDRFDAYVLAETLRTDRARLRVLTPDSPATVTLRATCRAGKDLVNTRVAVANQLRAHLQNAFPAGALLFAAIDSTISLDFLTRFTHQALADWLSPKRLAHWLNAVGYCGRTSAEDLHTRLLAAPRGPADDEGLARAHITLAYVATLRTGPRRSAAVRDRRLPSPLPHPRVAGLPGRRRTEHQSVRQEPPRRRPLVLRQATA